VFIGLSINALADRALPAEVGFSRPRRPANGALTHPVSDGENGGATFQARVAKSEMCFDCFMFAGRCVCQSTGTLAERGRRAGEISLQLDMVYCVACLIPGRWPEYLRVCRREGCTGKRLVVDGAIAIGSCGLAPFWNPQALGS